MEPEFRQGELVKYLQIVHRVFIHVTSKIERISIQAPHITVQQEFCYKDARSANEGLKKGDR